MDYEERAVVRNRQVNFGMYAPLTLIEVVDRIAASEQLTPNKVLIRLLRKGLVAERAEREAALRERV